MSAWGGKREGSGRPRREPTATLRVPACTSEVARPLLEGLLAGVRAQVAPAGESVTFLEVAAVAGGHLEITVEVGSGDALKVMRFPLVLGEAVKEQKS